MLSGLLLRDFVIVDALELRFDEGFTVLSGETGAGKSILLDAIGLTLGGRADSAAVREGAARADITAEFRIGAETETWLAERDLAGDAGIVQMRRIVESDGRSRALINGHPATAALLRELGASLLEIHGQHASQSLMRADGQRALLDRFAGTSASLPALADAHADVRRCERDLQQAREHSREQQLERERLQWQVDELEQLKLVDGEWEQLNVEQKRLANAAALIEGGRGAADALREADDAIAPRLHQIAQRIRPLAAIDDDLRAALELIEQAEIQVEEAASTLSGYADRVELDPQRLEAVEQRMSTLFSAARKLRIAPDELSSHLTELVQRLQQLIASQDVDTLEARLAAARDVYEQRAREVSLRRRTAARDLAAGVTERLARLAMTGGRFEIAIEAGEPTAFGIDRIEFLIAAHAGATPRPLSKVASGGELSRIGLAISELAAQANPVPTMIFDEADAGVGGAVAEVIGTLMRNLGQTRQVLCVTHLPQVAARAHHHFAVSKRSVDGRTVSEVRPLDRAARVEEIARMLGGRELTSTTRKHARELLAQD